MTVVVGEAVPGLDAFGPGARQRVGSKVSAGDFLLAVYPVGIPRDRVDAGVVLERDAERQEKFHIAPTAAVAAHRDGGLAAGQQHTRRRQWLAVPCDLESDTGHHLGHVARLAL